VAVLLAPVSGRRAPRCELFAYAWLKRRRTPDAEALRSRLRTNPDPIYGGGFREVHDAVQRHGIAAVLSELLSTGQLP
jgi:hypothetical protein